MTSWRWTCGATQQVTSPRCAAVLNNRRLVGRRLPPPHPWREQILLPPAHVLVSAVCQPATHHCNPYVSHTASHATRPPPRSHTAPAFRFPPALPRHTHTHTQDISAYSLLRLATDVKDAITALGHQHAHTLMAHDWGGAVAWVAAGMFGSSIIRRLVVMAAPHMGVASTNMSAGQYVKSLYILSFQVWCD